MRTAGRRACAAGHQARRWGADRGSGTLWALTFMAVVWLAAVLAMSVGGVRTARHRAHAAADLAALAAASRAAAGAGAGRACGRAAEIAAASGARLAACVLRGQIADVTVTMTIRVAVSSHRLRVVARARAGPSDHRFPGRNLRARDSLYQVSNSVTGGRPMRVSPGVDRAAGEAGAGHLRIHHSSVSRATEWLDYLQ